MENKLLYTLYGLYWLQSTTKMSDVIIKLQHKCRLIDARQFFFFAYLCRTIFFLIQKFYLFLNYIHRKEAYFSFKGQKW